MVTLCATNAMTYLVNNKKQINADIIPDQIMQEECANHALSTRPKGTSLKHKKMKTSVLLEIR